MIQKKDLSDALRNDMIEKKIDVDLTLQILNNYNQGKYDHVEPVKASRIPVIDNETVIDMRGEVLLTVPLQDARNRLRHLGCNVPIEKIGSSNNGTIRFNKQQLYQLGTYLFPLLSYGVLNGGSATSYADTKKNSKFDSSLFHILKHAFHKMSELAKGKPKGTTPAFINKNGNIGPSFLELKMRALLIQALRYSKLTGKDPSTLQPLFFQMTSVYNNDEIAQTYNQYLQSPLLRELIQALHLPICEAETGVQPMLSAFTHSEEGRPKRIFDKAYNKPNNSLPLPGGHGQNFSVLKNVYTKLYQKGKRFVYLGNVDNLGFTPDPIALAYLALRGKQAAFDFSFRTAVDIKGGILIEDQYQNINCADIGPAISKEDVFKAEQQGKKILFNCATGLFNLEYLVENIDYITENLPTRISDQDKDAGKYSQAEQVTWEVLGLLDDFLVYGVDKYDRFLAAKLLMETLMTSGLKLDSPDYPTDSDPSKDLKSVAEQLHAGFREKMKTLYGMKEVNNEWIPKSMEELV